MGAEGVVLGHAAPVGVYNGFAVLLGANAVAPVIGIGKAAARPTQHGHMQGFQRGYNIIAHAVGVGNIRSLTDINALIDAAAQMLRKLTVNVGVDGADRTVGVHKNTCHKNTSQK